MTTPLQGRFEVEELLGRGEATQVYLAEDTWRGGELVAVKILLKATHEHLAALRGEYALARRLRHPGIAHVRHLGTWDREGRLALVSDYVEGTPLDRWSGDRSPVEVAGRLAHATGTLAAMHAAGVLHGDVKPAHVLVTDNDATRLVDLGLASLRSNRDTRLAGTPAFLSPERVRTGETGEAADVFAMAATAVACLSEQLLDLTLVGTADDAEWSEYLNDLLAHSNLAELTAALRPALALAASERPSATELSSAFARVAGLGVPAALVADRLVGRVDEIQRLHRLVDATGPTVVLLTGPPGAGKSRLADELVTHIELSGGVAIGGPRRSLADPAEALFAHLASLGVSMAAEHEMVDAAAADLLAGLDAIDSPVLVWLDDITADDLLSRRLLRATIGEIEARRLAADRPGAPLLICVTCNNADELLPDDATPAETIRVPYFDAATTAQYLREAMAPTLPSRALSARIHELTGGRPEWVRAAARGSEGSGDVTELLADTTEEQRELLACLACFDEPADTDLVRTATREPLPPADQVARLVDDGLLAVTPTARGLAWSIPGRWLRERLRDHEPATAQRARHEHIAEHLADTELRGVHVLRAGHLEEGAALLMAAAETACAQGDARRARRLAGTLEYEAAEWRDRHRVLRLSAELDLRLGEPAAAEATLATLLELPGSQPGDRLLRGEALAELGEYARALEVMGDEAPFELRGRLLIHLGHYDEARKLVEGAQTVTATSRAHYHHLLGLLGHYRADTTGAERHLHQALEAALQAGDDKLTASIQSSLGLALQRLDKRAEALTMYTASLRTIRAIGDRAREPARLLNIGTVHQDDGNWQAAIDHYRESLHTAAQLRHEREVVRVGYNLANVLVALGALDEAETLIVEAAAVAERLAMRVDRALFELLRAEMANARLDPVAATRALDQVAGAQLSANAVVSRDLAVQRATAALLQRDGDAARRALDTIATPDTEVRLLAARIEIADARGTPTLGRSLLAEAEPGLTGIDRWQWHALACMVARRTDDDAGVAFHAQRAEQHLAALRASLPERYRGTYMRVPQHAELLRSLQAEIATSAPATRDHGSAARLQRILQINKRLGRELELKRLLELILDEALDLARAERGFVLLAEGDDFRVQAARHLDMEGVRRPESKFSQSLARQVVESGEPLVTVDAMADDRFREQVSIHDLRLRSVTCVPLEIEGKTAGALYLDNRFRANAFDSEMVEALMAFADQAAIAIQHARLRAALLERQKHLEASQEELARVNTALEEEVETTTSQLTEATALLRSERDEQRLRYRFANIVARSRAMIDALDRVERLAGVNLSVFVHGESGTGKELVARALHNASPRADGPFVAINCAAIPDSLLESELFGAKRGAFTGADVDRPGLFALANGGTLLLDEIGDMSLTMQAKLLRVLEDKTFRPLGGQESVTTDVRVVCSSNKDLAEQAQRAEFREDLFYRLSGATVRLPPLRTRREDIPELCEYLLGRAVADLGVEQPPELSPICLQVLMAYDWPGNIRQLDNELRRALAFAGDTIEPGHLSPGVAGQGVSGAPRLPRGKGAFRAAVADFERSLLLAALEQTDWDARVAAEKLGLSRSVFYDKLKRYAIRRPEE